tara:strand:+ start:414 stop:572 length:159 start_codon:yes stop_codon:yes gene_type:complete
MSNIQNRIWASRIRNLPADQDVSPAEAESPPQPVAEEQPEAPAPETDQSEDN